MSSDRQVADLEVRNHDKMTMTQSSFENVLRSRFSCRGYLQRDVPQATIEEMLELAQASPSWCNSQPWHVHVTTGEATERFRAGLMDYATGNTDAMTGVPMKPDFPFPGPYTGIYKQRQRECGWQLYESVGVALGDRAASARQMMENFRLFGAPHVLVITSERDLGTYGAIDCGAYLACLLLAAQSLGLASVPQAAIAGCAPFVRSFFDLPDDRLIIAGVSFGYPDPDHPANAFRTRRASLAETVDWKHA